MQGPLSTFTPEGLSACIAGNPADFYLPTNADLREHADLQLVVEGRTLPAHAAILAQRAPIFGPHLAAQTTEPLLEPFQGDSLRSALILLRLCYRPEEAREGLKSCFDELPTMLPMLHRLNALHFLSVLDLSGKPPTVLLRWLDTCSQLEGLEELAAECATRVINGVDDLARRSSSTAPTDLAFTALDMMALPLEGLCPAAAALLCRAALAVVADMRCRKHKVVRRLMREEEAELDLLAKQRKVEEIEEAKAVGDLAVADVAMLTGRALHGSYSWDVSMAEAEVEAAGGMALTSEPFSIGGLEWRLRMVPEARLPPGVAVPDDLTEGYDDKWMSVWLEAVHPERLPAAGLQAFVNLKLLHFSNEEDDHRWIAIRRQEAVVLSPTSPAAAMHPFCNSQDTLMSSYDYANELCVFRLRLQLCLAPSPSAAAGA